MKISIFGLGYVGTVSGACLAGLGHQVIGVDVNPLKVRLVNEGHSPVLEEKIEDLVKAGVSSGRLRATVDAAEAVSGSDVSLISAGTPSGRGGIPVLDGVEAVARAIGQSLRDKREPHTVVVRSTVTPGTTEERVAPILERESGRKVGQGLHVTFNPEFLREGSSVRDFHAPPQTIIGSMSPEGYVVVEGLYAGIDAPVVRTDCRTAETVKYLCNVFHALKIAFANEAGALLKTMGLDGRESMAIFCRDRILNISPAYLRPGFAFGGSCLPKDTRALLAMARAADLELPLLGSILGSNEAHVERAFGMVHRRGRRRVALFGLAFKAGTDDLRESPLVQLAERLVGKGYDLVIHDPLVDASRLLGKNKEYIEREIPHFERLLVADPRAAAEHGDTIVVGHVDASAQEAIAAVAAGRAVIDLQGVAALQSIPGVDYEGPCW
jgi:GDP-mannose 6-dehydrogenase